MPVEGLAVANSDGSKNVLDVFGDLLEEFDCQPVLFVGAGLSIRYIDGPSWAEVLRIALKTIGKNEDEISYIWQKNSSDLIRIGSEAADMVFEWAWKFARDQFEPELFSPDLPKSVFIKTVIAEHLKSLENNISTPADDIIASEIEAFKRIRPHAVITTNYDNMIESMLEGYESIVGNNVLKYNINAYGEVYHIHGSIEDPNTIVLIDEDYKDWSKNSKYFASKLLTYFVEHPIFIVGYALSDPNVRTILGDIGRYVADDTGLIGNVVQVVWHAEENFESQETEFALEADGIQYRIRVIHVNSMLEVFRSLQARHELKNVSPAIVRALAARVMQLTRRDIPNGNIDVDYKTLENATLGENLPAMLGLTIANNLNMQHPHLLSAVGKSLGFAGWHGADKIIKRIKEETGIDIKASDNKYHCRVKTGNGPNSFSRKFSDEALALFQRVRDGETYVVDIE